jgi:hypothetical protein
MKLIKRVLIGILVLFVAFFVLPAHCRDAMGRPAEGHS